MPLMTSALVETNLDFCSTASLGDALLRRQIDRIPEGQNNGMKPGHGRIRTHVHSVSQPTWLASALDCSATKTLFYNSITM